MNIQVVRGDINIATSILGTDLNYPAVKNIQPQVGVFFRQEDLDTANPVAVLGAKVRDDLFAPSESAIGADIRIRGKRYSVVGVMERTREIGLRKAVGATSSAILNQFLMEAIVIASIGGTIGVGLGVAFAFAAATAFKFPFIVPLWSVVVGFVLSLIVGVLAGGIPARNAARLDPILALHGE